MKGFDIISEDKGYTIWTGKIFVQIPHKHTDYKRSVISKIKPRLERWRRKVLYLLREDTRFKV